MLKKTQYTFIHSYLFPVPCSLFPPYANNFSNQSGFLYLPDLYAEMRLDYLGFDFNGWSDEERFRNIAPEFRDEAIKLYRSIMGIGWTLKAITGAVLLIPYQIVASGLVFMVSKSKKHGS